MWYFSCMNHLPVAAYSLADGRWVDPENEGEPLKAYTNPQGTESVAVYSCELKAGPKFTFLIYTRVPNNPTVVRHETRLLNGQPKGLSFQEVNGLFGFCIHCIFRSQLTGSDLITFDILNSIILDMIGMERDGDGINKAGRGVRDLRVQLPAKRLTELWSIIR
ncbi:uncharacterized protein K444DRAFT_638309 [Hyaloscypha bicolor E]|uniref:Uncharacterized protein n=1 Tax=Hyaloscypha bicolor E TaxID=1095630 RepID=A0A2J6SFX9_9HELO|nr:uncharacterized protein K444DRAFT_638309 [Hyaloscypha bicolor E]PMD49678.1 hypothetical protein K444DRAFT_638309 [Hyaloscypha bicolor E]